ncbi:MAG TPA: Holliday junction branch migration protein RuvA [Bacteroidales bacterium]|nr:Holliday junction branch migration protein RuvA [Bacteroidales bacterium]
MIEYIKGRIIELTPTFLVIESSGIGYFVNISLCSFSQLEGSTEPQLLIHEIIREDSQQLFGFAGVYERQIFRHLISVSGVGANTARMMLSSLDPKEIETAILESDVNSLKSIKGIGLKTAQRIIVDLKDRVGKSTVAGEIFDLPGNTKRDEAFTALVMLGFPRSNVGKVLDKLLREDRELAVEMLIKEALKIL